MHDSSSQSISGKWKTIGAHKRQSSILNQLNPAQKAPTKRYRPSKDKQSSNSKIFNIANAARSRIQSFDGLKQEGNMKQSKQRESSKDKKTLHKSISLDGPLIRINSVPVANQYTNNFKQGGITNRSVAKTLNFTQQKQLMSLKEDYAKFKQKMITQLQIQKQNMTKMVNQILESVKQQLLIIQQKYAKNSNNLKLMDINSQSFKNFGVPSINTPLVSQIKLPDISTIKNVSPRAFNKNPTEKALISELTSIKSVQTDPVTERFSKFYSAIQKLKSDLDSLHQISTMNNQHYENSVTLPLNSPSNSNQKSNIGFKSSMSTFLKT